MLDAGSFAPNSWQRRIGRRAGAWQGGLTVGFAAGRWMRENSAMKEATARIKINRHRREAGWRFFENSNGPANIQLEVTCPLNHQLQE